MELLINPPIEEIRPVALECLNQCFPQWGGDADFDWHFRRTVGGRQTDVMLVRENGRFVSGSAVVYRPVRLSADEPAEVGIMASSWTLPEARGRGHFSRIIETSVDLVRKNGVALLVAYVTSVNASARRLLASGASGYPTHYLIGDGSGPPLSGMPLPEVLDATEAGLGEVMAASMAVAGQSRFTYTPDEWREQYWRRPYETRVLRIGGLGTAVVETKHEFDRLIAFSKPGNEGADCLAPLMAWSHARGQKFFCFTTNDAWRDRAVSLGLRHLPGFLTARVGTAGPASPGSWFIQNGDRM